MCQKPNLQNTPIETRDITMDICRIGAISYFLPGAKSINSQWHQCTLQLTSGKLSWIRWEHLWQKLSSLQPRVRSTAVS